jgi:hypothetical protein
MLCGLADNKDNHKRVTTEIIYITGGSAETHENLVEKVLEFGEAKNMARNWMTFLRWNFMLLRKRLLQRARNVLIFHV